MNTPMPPEAPVPLTPEGKRAAEKVRTIFACIVAANLALIGIVIWHNYPGKGDAVRAKDAASAMEKTIEQSVAAYNAGDASAFSALFATTARSAGTGSNPALRLDEYHREFGRVLAKMLLAQPGTPVGDGVTLVHEVTCENGPRARLVTKFTREQEAMKLAEWHIERP